MLRVAFALSLVLATALAGCTTEPDEPPATTTPPPTGTTPTTTTPPTTETNETEPPATPPPVVVTDSGAIQGQFEKTWSLSVPLVSPRQANVMFNLTGAQAGAPVTARVFLQLLAPDGASLKTATLGVGGTGDAVSWALTPGDLPTTGDYTIRASADTSTVPPGVPSGGVANYALFAVVEY